MAGAVGLWRKLQLGKSGGAGIGLQGREALCRQVFPQIFFLPGAGSDEGTCTKVLGRRLHLKEVPYTEPLL